VTIQDETHIPAQSESKRHRNQMTQLHEAVEIVTDILVSYIHKDPQSRDSDPATVCSWRTYHVIQIKCKTLKNWIKL